MKKFLFFLIFFFFVSSVSAYTIICTNEMKGVQIWDLDQTFNETGWILEDIENEEGLNCTLIETSITLENCQEYEPVINQLNQNLRDKTDKINELEKLTKRQGFYKWFAIIFMVLSVVLIILLKINSMEGRKT